MIYLNLTIATLRSPEYIGSEPTERATWLNLLAYSCEQENGGVIHNCEAWKDRQWQQTCGVTLKEAKTDCDLWRWVDGSLEVAFYPHDKQAEVQHNRGAGASGGKKITQAKTQAARDNGAKGGRPKTQAETQAETQEHNPTETQDAKITQALKPNNPSENPTERKGKEGKEKERKEGEELGFSQPPPLGCPESLLPRVNSLKKSWQASPHLTQPELWDLHKNSTGLLEKSMEDWRRLKNFADSTEGQCDYTLKTRARFLANCSEVFQKADEWEARGGKAKPAHHDLGGRKESTRTIV